jgi:hypothetical protein
MQRLFPEKKIKLQVLFVFVPEFFSDKVAGFGQILISDKALKLDLHKISKVFLNII